MHEIRLPLLGHMMERGTLVAWLKGEGDSCEIGEPLYEVETDKATTTVETTVSGTLLRVVVPEGEEVPVGALLAIAAEPGERPGEQVLDALVAAEADRGEDTDGPSSSPQVPPPPAGGDAPAGTGGDGRVRAMPRARALARELGIDLAAVGAGQPGTPITVEDVQRTAARAADVRRVRERRPLRGVARSMAEVLASSWSQIPHMMQSVSVDCTALRARRAAERQAVQQHDGSQLTYSDLIHEALVRAAREVPEVNASLEGDTVVIYEDVNLAVAVASDAGLVAPVIHRAQELSLAGLSQRREELVRRARGGTLELTDVRGGTITASNLGMFGIDFAMPLIALPQSAIVFAGSMRDRPVAINGLLAIRTTMHLSVSYDHRVVDGVTGAAFAIALKRNLEGGAPH